MPDLTRDPEGTDIELVAEPACCPGGVCGPIFETPLLEVAFIRIRGLVRGRNGGTAPATSVPAVDALLPDAPGADPLPRSRRDSPHD